MASNLGLEGIEAIVLRTVSDQPTLWDAILPSELLVLPAELARVDALLDDPVFFAPVPGGKVHTFSGRVPTASSLGRGPGQRRSN
jgi:hypothetical protein